MRGNHLVREARRRASLTQTELARRAGTTQSVIARVEAGTTQPSLEYISGWCARAVTTSTFTSRLSTTVSGRSR